MARKRIITNDTHKPITMSDLGRFADGVIFPGVERIVGEKFNVLDEKFSVFDEKINVLDEKINNFHDEIIRETIQSNDRVITKLDIILKEYAAHTASHLRITDDFENHDQRITRLEKVAVNK